LEIVDQFLKMPKVDVIENPEDLKKISSLSFEKVSFSYNQSNIQAVKDIYFYAKQGETIAFVGPSGSGKSTVIKLLTGLYMPTEGSISINDKNIKLFNSNDLRDKIGLVLQETQLFSGSIRDNLMFVKSNATEPECLKALYSAQATSIFERSGEGLDTKIGEGGMKLSGGERQRLAIARALLRRPNLLIFDEATSALDSLTEKEITDTIQSVSEVEKKTIKVLVAHRLSTVLHADRIYVLEKGTIVEYGNHKDL
jgi:ATP-binding cassette, subfamily B, bacterial